jgi:deoxyribose-phosphate aldolase
MTRSELAQRLDHSVLKPEANAFDIQSGADVVLAWHIGFYCVQPCWVSTAAKRLSASAARVVAVIGFPHGCEASEVKAAAAARAVADGAEELDMVINLGALKSGFDSLVVADIERVVRAAAHIPVKVILETAVLTHDEKLRACRHVRAAGAAFVKTSTGFHPAGGATVEDVRLLRATVGEGFGVKASGGIRTLSDALAMLDAGANRLGTSASAAILEALQPSP